MRILLVATAFNGLTQRFYTELKDADYEVSVELYLGNDEILLEGVRSYEPELIICPFLTCRLPAALHNEYLCIIVHPGIKGDRGPSSLDWAIQNNVEHWGVTLLTAEEEMDTGDIWASRTFPMRSATKSSIYNREITQGAVECLWEMLSKMQSPDFRPRPLNYNDPDVHGSLQPFMKQKDRQIDWHVHTTGEIIRRINAADGLPGVLDEICGKFVFLHNARKEKILSGKPGEIIAVAEKAICRATVDGAVWIGHLKPKFELDGQKIKLPATDILKEVLSSDLENVEINYFTPGKKLPCQEVWYELDNNIAYLHFAFHNGAMNTEQCELLQTVYQYVSELPIKAIVLMGGENFWSNGIHLNTIEAAENPSDESWENINSIDDIVLAIINTPDKLTVAAMAGNAGAGGAILALAADVVLARKGIMLNPHYKSMGNLYGSEYWTYLLPKRVGRNTTEQLTEQCLPISTDQAFELGMIDEVLDHDHAVFYEQVSKRVRASVSSEVSFQNFLRNKHQARQNDEAVQALAIYRANELEKMHINFYGEDNSYHRARHRFVYKIPCNNTPLNIAAHRQGVADLAEDSCLM